MRPEPAVIRDGFQPNHRNDRKSSTQEGRASEYRYVYNPAAGISGNGVRQAGPRPNDRCCRFDADNQKWRWHMFMPGAVCSRKFWFVIDYRDMSMWVYGTDGSMMFVGVF